MDTKFTLETPGAQFCGLVKENGTLSLGNAMIRRENLKV